MAYHAALLLGELGLNRSEELGSDGRRLVADRLLKNLGGASAGRASRRSCFCPG